VGSQPAQTGPTLIPPSLEHRPERTIPVIEGSGRPQYIGNGSFLTVSR